MKRLSIKRKKDCCYSCYYVSPAAYTVVVWTMNATQTATDRDVQIKLIGDVCQTDWHELNKPFPYNDRERGARDAYTFKDNDIGSKVK